MLLLLFLPFFLVACEEPEDDGQEENIGPVDYMVENNYVYENELDIPVEIEYYWGNLSEEGEPPCSRVNVKPICVGGSVTQTMWALGPTRSTEDWEAGMIIAYADSVRLVFDRKKELWYRQHGFNYRNGSTSKPWNMINGATDADSYEERKEGPKEKTPYTKYTYTYRIRQEIYDLATDIKTE